MILAICLWLSARWESIKLWFGGIMSQEQPADPTVCAKCEPSGIYDDDEDDEELLREAIDHVKSIRTALPETVARAEADSPVPIHIGQIPEDIGKPDRIAYGIWPAMVAEEEKRRSEMLAALEESRRRQQAEELEAEELRRPQAAMESDLAALTDAFRSIDDTPACDDAPAIDIPAADDGISADSGGGDSGGAGASSDW